MKKNAIGMTLIELIIAIALLGIITVAFINVFSFGYISIINAGKNTEAGYTAQKNLENEIINDTSVANQTMIISFPGGVNVQVNGTAIEEEITEGQSTIKVNTFIPKP